MLETRSTGASPAPCRAYNRVTTARRLVGAASWRPSLVSGARGARRTKCELGSDPELSPDEVPVVARRAEEDLGTLRPLEVQVGRVFPREADTAVHLDVLGRGPQVRVGA